MKILKILAGIVAFIAVALLIMYFSISSTGHMERSIAIDASPEKIFVELNSFKNFNKWSPWAEIDPNTAYTYEGPEEGVGAIMYWKSDDPNVGNGMQEILESVPNSKVKNKMEFEGFGGVTSASFILESDDSGTKVTWTYDASEQSGIGKFMNLAIDSFLGPSYEKGLENLKLHVESMPDPMPSVIEIEIPMESDSVESNQ